MTLAEIQQAGPGAKIQGELQLYVHSHKTVVNGQHTVVVVGDSSGVTMDAIIFGTTAVQVGAWYRAAQQIGPKGPKVKYQQRGDNPPGLAIDGSVFSLMQAGGPGPVTVSQPPPAAAPPPPPPQAAAPPPPPPLPAGKPGALTDERMLSAIEAWVGRLDASAKHLSTENMSTILGSFIIAATRGDLLVTMPRAATVPQAAGGSPTQEEYWTVPPGDDDSVPF